MDHKEFEAAKATFPWKEHLMHTATGGLVQIVDNAGNEVSIFTVTRFLEMITLRLAKPAEKKETT